MSSKIIYTHNDILKILPHRPPFLFVDHVVGFKKDIRIKTERLIRKDEPFFEGHFPQKAIMPGVLVIDALAQTSGLLWGFSKQIEKEGSSDKNTEPEIFFLAVSNIKFVNPSFPGDTLEMSAYAENNYGDLFTYAVEAIVKRNVIAKGTLTLAMMKGKL